MNQIRETETTKSRLACSLEEINAVFDYSSTRSIVTLPIRNDGSDTLTIVGSGWSYPFRGFDPETELPARYRPSLDTIFERPAPIVPGATVNITLELEISEPFSAESPAFGCVGLFTEADEVLCPVKLCLLPSVMAAGDTFTVREPKPFPIIVSLQSASELSDVTRVEGLATAWDVKRVSARHLHLSCNWTPPANFHRETRSEPVAIGFEGIPHTLIHPIQLILHRCAEPLLVFRSETPVVLNEGRQRVLHFELTNIGANDLTISDVIAIQPENGVALVPDHGLAGLRLASQKTVSVPLLVAIASAEGDTAVGLQVFTDSPSLPMIELRQPVEVTCFPRLSSPIGFDFGTVNSCVGFMDETFMEATLVKIPVEIEADRVSLEEIFPSVLHMETFPAEGDEAAYSPMLSFITKRSDSINVQEVKSAFCRGEKIAVRGADGLERSFASGIFISQLLANLLSYTEHSLKRTFHDAVITVPTKYGSRTVRDMKDALGAIGFAAGRVHVYDESTSAAMFYIRRGRSSEFLRAFNLPENYAMAIMDVGGGTTDISILDVTDRETDDARQLEVTLRGTTGRIRFGGTHFNHRIEERWFVDYVAACGELGASLSGLDDLDFEQSQEMLRPRAELAEAVETAKCRLASRAEYPYVNIGGALSCYRTLAREPTVEIDPGLLPKHLTNLCRATLDDLLGRDLSDIIAEVNLMARTLVKHPLGVVLLVGQSSQLQTVRDAMTATFGVDKIALVPAETSKSCVVQGALELHQLLHNPGGVAFKFRDLSHAVSVRIGVLWSGRYEMEFKELIAVGADLPARGAFELPPRMFSETDRFSIDLLGNYGAKNTIQGNENIVRLGRFVCPTPIANSAGRSLVVEADENMVLTVSLTGDNETVELRRDE